MSVPVEVVESVSVIGPHLGLVAVLAVTTSSARFDLGAAGQLGTEIDKGILTFKADGGKVFFYFNNADAGTADGTATSGNNRTYMLSDGERMDLKLRNGFQWIVLIGSAAGFLRVYRSSRQGGID